MLRRRLAVVDDPHAAVAGHQVGAIVFTPKAEGLAEFG
jgi:hypothetical protein